VLGPFILGPDGENVGVYEGNSYVLCEQIPDESVRCILTDPLYEDIEQYRWLGKMANRVLMPNSSLLAFFGIGYLPDTIAAICESGLTWKWLLTGTFIGRHQFLGKLQVLTTVCMWFTKGKMSPYASVADNMQLPHESRGHRYLQDSGASWDKHPKLIRYYVEAFSKTGDIVLDPFAGHGSIPAYAKKLGRKFLAFEHKPEVAEHARKRIRDTLVDVYLPGFEQIKLDLTKG
jgi:hypothetical protein